jgi:hypothetical protein
LIAETGETFFTTQTLPGINYVFIAWYDDKLSVHSSLKSSTWKPCDAPMAREPDGAEEMEEELSFAVRAYPNPVSDRFYIAVKAQDDSEVNIELISMQGQQILNTKVNGNSETEIDATTYAPGLYVIKARQKNNVRMVKISR